MNAWKGVPSMILRADESRSITIDNPFLTIYGTIQPDVARILLNDKGWDDGFLDRWLFAYPGLGEVGLPGGEDLGFLKISWNNVVARLLSLELGSEGEPFFITLDEGAYGLWVEWQKGFSAELNGGAEPRGPLVKLSQYVMRFIGILHVIRWATAGAEDYATATVEDVEGAIKLFDYFRRGLNRIYAAVFVDVTDVTATSVTRSCVVCDRDITHKRSDARVCGDTCRQALKRQGDVTTISVTSVTGGEA